MSVGHRDNIFFRESAPARGLYGRQIDAAKRADPVPVPVRPPSIEDRLDQIEDAITDLIDLIAAVQQATVQPPAALLSSAAAAEILAVAASTFRRLRHDPGFPAPVALPKQEAQS